MSRQARRFHQATASEMAFLSCFTVLGLGFSQLLDPPNDFPSAPQSAELAVHFAAHDCPQTSFPSW
jgi:hypothetical protein